MCVVLAFRSSTECVVKRDPYILVGEFGVDDGMYCVEVGLRWVEGRVLAAAFRWLVYVSFA